MMKSKKWMTLIGLILILIYLSVNIWMLSSVKATLRTIYLHPEKDNQIVHKQVTESALNKFHRNEIYRSSSSSQEEIIVYSTNVGFGLHIFYSGTIWIKYTYKAIDKNTMEVKYGSSRVPMQLKVKLKNGIWRITDKYEKP
jgi:predicted glycosyl hydrolase (DUF1957 family)